MRYLSWILMALFVSMPSFADPIAIKNARVPVDGVLSGGKPDRAQIEAAGQAGYKTVINLRTEAESGFEWEAEAVEAAGMRYVHLPIAGGRDLTPEKVEAFAGALDGALARGPVLLHCGSGNRIGALFALRSAWLEERPAETALEFGRASGLTSLEPRVRELLGLQAP